VNTPDWKHLKSDHDCRAVDALSTLLSTTGPVELTAKFLSAQSGVAESQCSLLLGEIVTAGVLAKKEVFVCPQCDKSLPEEEAQGEKCPNCQFSFSEKQPVRISIFVRDVPRARDILWVLTLHGMNTRGAWQEDLNWLVSRSYGRMVPVAIYKYGMIRPGAVLKFRQRQLTRGLNARIRRLTGETRTAGFGGTPDVIAHSFGTWLLGHALRSDPTLQVGRVILTGCILRPDFDWGSLITQGQVQEVLCHVATHDFWSRIAHYIIPDSGPSGRRGFNDRVAVAHAVLSDGRHSDFFEPVLMSGLFEEVWQPFLTGGEQKDTGSTTKLPATHWKQAWWPFRATVLRISLVAAVSALIAILVAALILGLVNLWEPFAHFMRNRQAH
jgi:hypothetical protein